MAELIPIEYRIDGMRKKLIVRWGILAALMAGVCGTGIFYANRWRSEQDNNHKVVIAEHDAKSVVIAAGMKTTKELQELRERMMKLDQLQNDQVLISLLATASQCVREKDIVYYVGINAHDTPRGAGAATQRDRDYSYQMHLAGYTLNDQSHDELFERLTSAGDPVKGNPKATRFDVDFGTHMKKMDFLDGNLVQFQIECHKPTKAG